MKKKNGLRLPEVVRDTIIELGAVFERRGKHTIFWRLPNGRLIGYSQTTTADDPATHNPQSAGTLQEELVALTHKLMADMERKPCDFPCPICGSAHIKRWYVNDRCAQDELRSPGISNLNRQFRTEPKLGKIHNTCECCHHEWNSEPLSKEPNDDHQA